VADEQQQREPLPFEPAKKRQKSAKKSPESGDSSQKDAKKTPITKEEMAIPAVVSQRMAKRMAFFSGIPTAFGMSTFVVSYFVVTQDWFKLSNTAVLLVSAGFFGLGVLGLTYGVLSASWDEDVPGSLLGGQEFSTNLGRTLAAWRAAKQEKNSP
jgi:Photosynthesis affected mutant 68